jgi:hypothetical protein
MMTVEGSPAALDVAVRSTVRSTAATRRHQSVDHDCRQDTPPNR